ncbi:MAG: 4-phosphopantoate--beta-alanine ligase [Methanomicrobiales archaeon]|nr:4-phosphopantoate--beta-alanine ligase [Methanomicrobiales archaeon]
MIPESHPRYRSLVVREHLVAMVCKGIVTHEGLIAHGRGEAFDYLLGEVSTESAIAACRLAARMICSAERPVISVNGNTAALAADEVAALQAASGARVEVNLFHRTDERIRKITAYLESHGVDVLSGVPVRNIPLAHDRALCLKEGIFSADLILVPLEDGDRCEALCAMGKEVITIDLNPLSRTARTATLTIVDELTRALPMITNACREINECPEMLPPTRPINNQYYLTAALNAIQERLCNAMD